MSFSSIKLVTIKKTTSKIHPPPTFDAPGDEDEDTNGHIPAHRDFREKYFQGFKSKVGESSPYR